MSLEPLERSLAELGAAIELPEPELAAGVRARIAEMPVRRRRARVRPWTWTRRSVALAGAIVIVSSGVAVATYLGVRGVKIHVGVSPTPSPKAGATMNLGTPTSLADARARVPFPVRVPMAFGDPDETYIDFEIIGGRVSMVYRPRAGLPEAANSGVGLLLIQFEGRIGREHMEKFVRADQIRTVSVDGNPGLWIEGAHTVGYTNSLGEFGADDLRVSDSTLLWEIGNVTLRLESALSMTDAIRLAESMR